MYMIYAPVCYTYKQREDKMDKVTKTVAQAVKKDGFKKVTVIADTDVFFTKDTPVIITVDGKFAGLVFKELHWFVFIGKHLTQQFIDAIDSDDDGIRNDFLDAQPQLDALDVDFSKFNRAFENQLNKWTMDLINKV